jgi:hypothetical protein
MSMAFQGEVKPIALSVKIFNREGPRRKRRKREGLLLAFAQDDDV